MPTPEELSKWAQAGAALFPGACGKMCNDCAFRKGSDANSDLAATEAAAVSLMWEGQFNCHTGDFKDAGSTCAGFEYAKKYIESDQFKKTLRIIRTHA